MAVLHAVDARRGSLQEPQGRLESATALSPERGAHRGAHICGVPGVLLARDLAGATAAIGAGADGSNSVGKICSDPNGKRAFSDDRWEGTHFSALHSAGKGSEDVVVPVGLGVTCTAPAPDHGKRRAAQGLSKGGILVQTF